MVIRKSLFALFVYFYLPNVSTASGGALCA